MLTYDRKFGNGHTISALALYEGSSYKYRNLQASRVNYISGPSTRSTQGPRRTFQTAAAPTKRP